MPTNLQRGGYVMAGLSSTAKVLQDPERKCANQFANLCHKKKRAADHTGAVAHQYACPQCCRRRWQLAICGARAQQQQAAADKPATIVLKSPTHLALPKAAANKPATLMLVPYVIFSLLLACIPQFIMVTAVPERIQDWSLPELTLFKTVHIATSTTLWWCSQHHRHNLPAAATLQHAQGLQHFPRAPLTSTKQHKPNAAQQCWPPLAARRRSQAAQAVQSPRAPQPCRLQHLVHRLADRI